MMCIGNLGESFVTLPIIPCFWGQSIRKLCFLQNDYYSQSHLASHYPDYLLTAPLSIIYFASFQVFYLEFIHSRLGPQTTPFPLMMMYSFLSHRTHHVKNRVLL